MWSMIVPFHTANPATRSCTINFGHAGRRKISSRIPSSTKTAPPIQTVTRLLLGVQRSIVVAVKARKIASPPIRGIGFVCIRRSSAGTSMAPILNASTRTGGVSVYARRNAQTAPMTKYMVFTTFRSIILPSPPPYRIVFPYPLWYRFHPSSAGWRRPLRPRSAQYSSRRCLPPASSD